MSYRRDTPKKPTGRPVPKRLFSIDALRREKSGQDADLAPVASKSGGSSGDAGVPPSYSSTSIIRAYVASVGEENTSWTDQTIVTSPDQIKEQATSNQKTSAKSHALRPPPLNLSASGDGVGPSATADEALLPSPARRRWATLRSHVLPSEGSVKSSTQPGTPNSAGTSTPPTSRPSTPKPHRFGAKKILRQVVEQAQDAAAEERSKFAEDILHGCWLARFGDAPKQRPKPERETSQTTLGGALHLTFMGSTASLASLPIAPSASMSSLHSGLGWRQASQHSADVRPGPSVAHLFHTLNYQVMISRPRRLPHEQQVLSALLVPFWGPCTVERVSVEQQTALEAFEHLLRTWKAPSNEVDLDRCLWCCSAASVPSGSRVRILGTLSSLLFSRDRTFNASTPIILRSLLQGTFALLLVLTGSPTSAAEAGSLREFIAAIEGGQCGTPSIESLEKEYGVRWSRNDNDAHVRHAIATESVIACLDLGSQNGRNRILQHFMEEYWSPLEPDVSLTPLLSCLTANNVRLFASAVSALFSANPAIHIADINVISRIFLTRIVPSLDVVHDTDVPETRKSVLKLALELSCKKDHQGRNSIISQLGRWTQDPVVWKNEFDEMMHELMLNSEWGQILQLLLPIAQGFPDELRTFFMGMVLPPLHDRLMASAPEYPCELLTEFLNSVSRTHPKMFFKPIFTCAASTKDLTVANQVCILSCLARYLPDFWCRDPDMVAVALMSDSSTQKLKTDQEERPKWGKARMGQSVLLLEIISFVRRVRLSKDDKLIAPVVGFVSALETRIGALAQIKEQTAQIPISQRLLFCALFREIRLLTSSLKPASWLLSVISWAMYEVSEDEADDVEEEVETNMNKLRALYVHAQEALRGGNRRRTTAWTSPTADGKKRAPTLENPAYDLLSGRLELIDAIRRPMPQALLPLLVLISGLLSALDYTHLAPVLWGCCMDTADADTCFLLMQCAERCPIELLQLIRNDLSHPIAEVRRLSIIRIAALCSWRFQILSQQVILDRSYRRPFRLARPPIQFVPTDMGSSLFVLNEDVYEFKDSHGHVLPLELCRRLVEIGWDEEDRTLDQKTRWTKTPLSLIPSLQLEALDTLDDAPASSESPHPSPDPSPGSSPSTGSMLLRRDSSASSVGRGKRRPVFVATLLELFPQIVSMAKGEDFMVASCARNFILDMMRDDPSLLTRSTLHSLSGDTENVITAVSTIISLLHVRHVIPPSTAHHLLNHLVGYLKSNVHEAQGKNLLLSYGYSMPSIAKLVTQVSKMSVREIRRSKVDTLLLPSGSLWFPPSAPAVPMFPRGLEEHRNPFEILAPSLVWIIMVRTSQNMLFLRMLEHDSQELKIIRKHLVTLALPTLSEESDGSLLPFIAFLPQHRNREASSNTAETTLAALSLTLARSYVLLVGQIFWSMSRHLSDRQELAILVDGLNRVLLKHSDDIGTVGQVMLAFMLASTRFKRMFISGGAYALFMPAIIKTYVQAESHAGIRTAIEYAVNRFYSLHQESFVFQSFDVISHMFMSPNVDQPWLARHVYTLFATLKDGTAPLAPDVAGIYDLNKLQEQENRMVAVAEDIPQTFLASLRKNSARKNEVTLVLPEEYEWKRLSLDDLVRLFLTVIAHNPGVQRAERFLRSFRLLAPHLYHASNTARAVLADGIDALGTILMSRITAKARTDNTTGRLADDLTYETLAEGTDHEPSQAAPCDITGMRIDYLFLIVAFTQAGGELGRTTSTRVLEMIKLILRESIISSDRIAAFLSDYLKSVLLREPAPPLKSVVSLLTEVVPIFGSYSTLVNFSGVLDIISALSTNTVFAHEPAFAQLVVNQYCRVGLEACEVAAAEGWLLSFPSRMSVINLMNCAITVTGANIMDELERHAPTHDFLAGVVIPFALSMKTGADIAAGQQWTDTWRRDVHAGAWVRLLFYILSCCQDPRPEKERSRGSLLERQKSQDSRTSKGSESKPTVTFSLVMQILKIIVIRAEEDLTLASPGIWLRIGTVLRSILYDGDASFAFARSDYSEPPSPLQSPRRGSFSSVLEKSPTLQPSLSSNATLQRLLPPRLVDYLAWSFIQWVLMRKNPLMLQMQGFIQEKVALVSEEQSRRGGMDTSFAASPVRTRRPSSIFAKPRRSMVHDGSAASSLASTPRNSMFLSASMSLPVFDEGSLQYSTPRKEGRVAGYAREVSPISPSGRIARESGPKIVHLGPVTPLSTYGSGGLQGRRSVTPGGTATSSGSGGRNEAARELEAAKKVLIKTPALVRMTYRRIRLAQRMMGYRILLPMGDSPITRLGVGVVPGEGAGGATEDEDGEDLELRAWTKRQALEGVLQEVKDLMEAFREEEYTDVGEGSGMLVDVNVEEPPSSPVKW